MKFTFGKVLLLGFLLSVTSSINAQLWAPVGTSPNDGCKSGQIYAILTYDSVIYAAGSFTTCNGGTTTCNHIAQWNGTTWKPVGTSPNDGVTGTIYAMAIFNGKLIVAGSISKCGGATTACNNIAQWNGTTWSVCGAAAGKDGVTGGGPVINALAVFNGKLCAGGYFTKCNGATNSCNNIAQWDGTTGAASWTVCGAANPKDGTQVGNWPISCLSVFNNKLMAGGAFNDCNGNNTACTNIAQWDGTTSATSWSVCGAAGKEGINYPGSTVLCMATFGTHLVVGGTFNGACCNGGTTTCNGVAQWDGTNTATSWSALGAGVNEGIAGGTKTVYSLNVASGALFIGGNFTTAAGTTITVNNVAYWNGTSFATMGTNPNYGTSTTVYASAIYGGVLYAGGTITKCNNTNTACNEIATFSGGPLPIELSLFHAVYSAADKDVLLDWTTETETNNKFFTIERTADFDNWQTVATVPSAAMNGNSSAPLYYTATDYSPFAGTSYYRLGQTDYDGHTTYFYPVPVDVPIDNSLAIFPNPASNQLNLRYGSMAIETLDVKITNMLGETILNTSYTSAIGANTYSMDVSSLASGVYIISLSNGSKTFVHKFIKE